MKYLAALLLPLALLIVIYAPVFFAVSLVRPSLAMLPLWIILGSLGLAMLLIFLFRTRTNLQSFGFRSCASRPLLLTLLLGIVLGGLLQFGTSRFPAHSPMDFSGLPLALLLLYFGLMAPIQEEVIFRGLLQTVSSRMLTGATPLMQKGLPVVICALLFGAVHFELNFATALAALVLGLVAGELRRRSESLAPAIVLHALCNGWSIAWPFLFR